MDIFCGNLVEFTCHNIVDRLLQLLILEREHWHLLLSFNCGLFLYFSILFGYHCIFHLKAAFELEIESIIGNIKILVYVYNFVLLFFFFRLLIFNFDGWWRILSKLNHFSDQKVLFLFLNVSFYGFYILTRGYLLFWFFLEDAIVILLVH